MLREARHDDILRMVELGRQFFAEAGLTDFMEYDEESAAGTFFGLIDNPDGAVFVMEVDGQVVGGVGAILAPHYFNLQHKSGQELFWYVDPQHRGGRESLQMLKTVQSWAKDRGAETLVLARMKTSPSAVGVLYERMGFGQMETYHMGRI